ncbi:RNA helicase domain-containing protein [Bifidobacterium amazonense]|uniref:RNA helicase domain-containing protein n=1 Tax=Bifidobacterium amazonense TaxID=2809027 RepID=A0ABS9VWW3_9BIFI|nr:RNA helicase domain-containing protein [Bifidobacterium amazonense]MCH9276562.1 RNA helicase domain-containing protein [Bifidobacterium amazonense]
MVEISGRERLSLVREIRYPDDDKKKKLNRHKRSRAWMVTIASKYVCGDWSVILDELNDMAAYGWSYMGQAEEGTGKRMASNKGKRPVDDDGQFLYGRGGKYRGMRHGHFIVYTPRMRMGTFADHFPTQAHIDPVDRSPKVVERYVTKLDTRLTMQDDGVDGGPWESEGFDPAGQGKRTDLKTRDDAVKKVLAGAIPDVLMRDDPKLIAYDRYLDRAYEIAMKEKGKKMRDVHTLYVYGETGVGKSLWAWLYGKRHDTDVYRLTDYAHPWDNYRGESVVIVEDFDGRMRLDDVLRWTDRYPVELTARYANKHALYDTVIFTSNKPMSGWYGYDEFEPKQGPINRRISTVCASLGSDGDTISFRHVAGPEWPEKLADESLRSMISESTGVAPSGADGRGYIEKPETALVKTPQPVTDGEAYPVDMSSPAALPFTVDADGIPIDLG